MSVTDDGAGKTPKSETDGGQLSERTADDYVTRSVRGWSIVLKCTLQYRW